MTPIHSRCPVPRHLPWSLACLLSAITLAASSLAWGMDESQHSIADWQLIAARETQQQAAAESSEEVRTLLLEQWAYLYGVVPITSLPHLTTWWKERGEAMMHGWLAAGCPLLTDHDHLLCYLLCVYDAYAAQKTSLLGATFSSAEVATMATLVAHIEKAGGELMTATYLSGT